MLFCFLFMFVCESAASHRNGFLQIEQSLLITLIQVSHGMCPDCSMLSFISLFFVSATFVVVVVVSVVAFVGL